MPRNRRNKRNMNKIIETISNETFRKIVIVIAIISICCIAIIRIRNYNDNLKVAKQKELLERQLDAIFEDKSVSKSKNNIANEVVNQTVQDNENQMANEITTISQEENTTVNIAIVGDILCGNAMLEDANINGEYEFNYLFSDISKYLKEADVAIGTMETNFTNSDYSGYLKCNSPYSFGQAVKNSGINVISTAHNHSLDYDLQGLKNTNTNLKQMGFEVVGTKNTLEEKNYIVKDVEGIKIAFLAYTYGFSDGAIISTEAEKYVNKFSKEMAKQDLENAKKEAEYICIIMHWGEINNIGATSQQKDVADFLIENGANMIVGSHPAVIEPMQIKQNSAGENVFISYSVGNYTSSLGYENSNLEMILNVQITKDNTGKVLLEKVTYTPVYMYDNGEKAGARNRFKLMDIKETAQKYLDGESDAVSKEVHDKLMEGLEKLEQIIRNI